MIRTMGDWLIILKCVPEPGIPDTAKRSRCEVGVALYLTWKGHNHSLTYTKVQTWVHAHSRFAEPAYSLALPCCQKRAL